MPAYRPETGTQRPACYSLPLRAHRYPGDTIRPVLIPPRDYGCLVASGTRESVEEAAVTMRAGYLYDRDSACALSLPTP